MKKTTTFFLVIILNICLSNIYAQNSLSGTVSDANSGESLWQVSVYFPKLEKGAVTDDNGKYSVKNLPTGSYNLIVSYIGYKTYSTTLTINEGENKKDVVLNPSTFEMEEVIVSTPFHQLQRDNVMKVETETIKDLQSKGAITLADGIRDIPGVSTISTGVGIGKPVIRGLSFNRVVVYTQNIRLENQQFGEEHGLGVNDAGISSVEVIKGPASLLYGPDAIGGVLYLNPELFAESNKSSGDVNLRYFSNTVGYSANGGFKTSGKNLKFLIRGSYASHEDYTTGGNVSATNTRFREFDVKTGLAYQTDKFKTEARYNYNASDLGITEDLEPETNERDPELPFQPIKNHVISSKSSLFFDKSNLDATFGLIVNNRKEFEDDQDEADLFLRLTTFSYNVQYHLPKTKRFQTVLGVQGMHQTNRTLGPETLIPNAITNDFGVLGAMHIHFEKSDIQIGARFDTRSINGEQMGVMGEEGFIETLNRDFNSVNLAAGYKYNFSDKITGRLNLATGFRAPNLSELTSNGVHEGTTRFEVGNPDLDNEQNIQVDVSLEYGDDQFQFYLNPFYNTVSDFIFIQSRGEFIDNNEVFDYLQQDAVLFGGEVSLHVHPKALDWMHIESSFETVRGRFDDDTDVPFIPAKKITNTVRAEWTSSTTKKKRYVFATLQNFFAQDQVAFLEPPSDGYSLLNLGFGIDFKLSKQPINLKVSANNILDKDYINHLSRLNILGISRYR